MATKRKRPSGGFQTHKVDLPVSRLALKTVIRAVRHEAEVVRRLVDDPAFAAKRKENIDELRMLRNVELDLMEL